MDERGTNSHSVEEIDEELDEELDKVKVNYALSKIKPPLMFLCQGIW
jgi:hypothetical protein